MTEPRAGLTNELLPANLRRERVCDRYEDAWLQGEEPRIDDFLAEVPEAERPELSRQLAELELRYRAAREWATQGESAARQSGSPDPVAVAFQKLQGTRELGEGLPAVLDRSGTDSELPRTFGRYRASKRLGKGAFGTVYLARDAELDRLVAIKVPNAERVAGATSVESYLREARILARLDHRHVVPVYDVGRTDDGLCYVVSKYIEGTDLAERIKQARPSLMQSAELVEHVAVALHHAHRHGLVHRDIKPANILIDGAGLPVVADFGVALADQDFGGSSSMAGTPAYMSPEQARGEGHRVDARSDIFSLGVVLYQLLTGQRPFQGKTRAEVMTQITTTEPEPLRAIDATIPRELERICLKALAKRPSDRYATALELAEDLHLFLRSDARAADPAAPVVPKGLRSFDQDDAGFFLELLPGPRGRDGVPESIRFWKGRIECADPEKTFGVGLIYGPSGCGKSSLVKAGLLPRLEKNVLAIFIEASAHDTETRLLSGLRKAVPSLRAELGLVDSIAAVRKGSVSLAGQKVLLVVDQFEQWLHANRGEENSDLVAALRQCDGEHVQALVMVRDDFWLATSRFMEALEVKLVEGWNTALVDLFDLRHARKALTAFGIANGDLPPREIDFSRSQQAFLDEAVTELAQDRKVIAVQIALFAEMLKGKPWTRAALRDLGGTAGVGVAFLEGTFGSSQSKPVYRRHHQAAQAVLKALLPGSGSDIKGRMRSEQELRSASGYADSPDDFHDLLRILENDLRLIAPTEESTNEQPARSERDRGSANQESAVFEGADSDRAQFGENASLRAPVAPVRYFQLTHDYLVPALRDWLTRKQRETRRGRAELRLAERAAAWRAKPENRYLPSALEWAGIRAFTRRRDWSDTERLLMRQAGRFHGMRALGIAVVTALASWGVIEGIGNLRAIGLVESLTTADTRDVPTIVKQLSPYRGWALPRLRRMLRDSDAESRDHRHAALALIDSDSALADHVADSLLKAAPSDLPAFTQALARHRRGATARFWSVLDRAGPSDASILPAAAALAAYDAQNERWKRQSPKVSRALVAVEPTQLAAWRDLLRPVRGQLTEPLKAIFKDQSRPEFEHIMAGSILGDYALDNPDLEVELLLAAGPTSYVKIFPLIERNSRSYIPRLETELAPKAAPWHDTPIDPAWASPGALKQRFELAKGILAERFAFCQTMLLDDFLLAAENLRTAGYCPVRFRPYADKNVVRVAAVWTRDGRSWHVESGLTPEEVIRKNRANRDANYLPVDVAGYITTDRDGQRNVRYSAIWVLGPESDDADIYVGLSQDEYLQYRGKLKARGLGPRTLHANPGSDGTLRYSGVWGRLAAEESDPRCYRNESRQSLEQKLDDESEGIVSDVTVILPDETQSCRLCRYAAIWRVPAPFEAVCNHDLDPAAHLERCRDLAEKGFRPLSISAVRTERDGRIVTASVWQRPVQSEDEKDHHAAQEARAAIALWRLRVGDSLIRLLRHSRDPRLRSNIINWLKPLGASAADLADALSRIESSGRGSGMSGQDPARQRGDASRMEAILFDPNTSTRRALILALGTFDADEVSPSVRRQLSDKLVTIYQQDPDAGIHGATEWTLRRWNEQGRLREAPAQLPGYRNRGERRWYVNTQGQTFTVVDGPVVFPMGSLRSDPDGFGSETHRRVLIPRRFAIAATEVTVEQFESFLKERPDLAGDTLDRQRHGPDREGPILGVSWLAATAYCNWLSRKEELEPFYPDEFNNHATLDVNALRDCRGYRLPTETEWEFACRAGAATSRYYGRSVDLLGNYARYAANSQDHTWPCGQLLPNDLGLFDMLGNAMEWCQDRWEHYTLGESGPASEDARTLGYDEMERCQRVVRGGVYHYNAEFIRSAYRNKVAPASGGSLIGFRLARTCD